MNNVSRKPTYSLCILVSVLVVTKTDEMGDGGEINDLRAQIFIFVKFTRVLSARRRNLY